MTKDRIKIPRIPSFLIRLCTMGDDDFSILREFSEEFKDRAASGGIIKAKLWYWNQTLRSLPYLLKESLFWRFTMLSNYVKTALRNLWRNKLYSLLNMSGLALGITSCMVICLWIMGEFSYDRFHEKSERIFRVERELFRDNSYSRWPIVSGAYRNALIDDIPEIENATRMWRRSMLVTDHNNINHRQLMYAVDNSIFEIFSFRLEEGDPNSALTEPNSVVLTREIALKYFGADDVVGRSIPVMWNDALTDFTVTGILGEVPSNSHVQFDMLMSIISYPAERFANWRSNYLYTYVLLTENADPLLVTEKLKEFVSNRLEAYYADLSVPGKSIHDVLKMYLFPVTEIHLNPSPVWEIEAGGNLAMVYVFISVAALILFIASANFMNLSTARAVKRAKEVGLKKTVGASRGQLGIQFLTESMLVSFLSLLLASLVLLFILPVVSFAFGDAQPLELFLSAESIALFTGITLITGFLSGLYPAFYLTRFTPAAVLKGKVSSGKSRFRRFLVGIQFVISITLIFGMITIYKQMNYIQQLSLGFDKENVLILNPNNRNADQGFDAFRSEILTHTKIHAVSVSSEAPVDVNFSNGYFRNSEDADEAYSLYMITAGYDIAEALGLEVLAGRSFSRQFSADTTGTIVLNEAAVKRYGWTPEEAIGKQLLWSRPENNSTVIGVVRDFNYRSLRSEVEPLVLILYPSYASTIIVRFTPGELDQTLSFIRAAWNETYPGEEFNYYFLEDRINQLYQNEKRTQNLFMIFSSLSVLVACLGLFGLAAYTTEERTKEIGIRKAIGASSGNVVVMLSREFTRWVVLANIAAWPLAWYLMDKWLQNFAYRTDLSWYLFLIAGLLALAIALITVSWQAVKASRANPVDSLRYE